MWLVGSLDGKATMEGLMEQSRSGGGIRMIAGSGLWAAGWRDPATGLLVALCGRSAVEDEPLIMLQSDGEQVARLPRNKAHRSASLTGLWGSQDVSVTKGPKRWSARYWDGRPTLVGKPRDLHAAKKAGLIPVLSLADSRQHELQSYIMEKIPNYTDQPVVMASVSNSSGHFAETFSGLAFTHEEHIRVVSVSEFDSSNPVVSAAKVVKVERFFDDRSVDDILSTLTCLEEAMSSFRRSIDTADSLIRLQDALSAEVSRRENIEKELIYARGKASSWEGRVERLTRELSRVRKDLLSAQRLIAELSPSDESDVQCDADEPVENNEQDNVTSVVITPIEVPKSVSECGSFEEVTRWAQEELKWVHVEDEALVSTGDLERHQKSRQWVRAYAQALAVLNGWAASKAAGWDGSPSTYTQQASSVVSDSAFRMSESSEVIDRQDWRKERIRRCCSDVADDGEDTHFFAKHVRIGRRHPAPRAHFELGRDGRVHVGYVGPHLTTGSTRQNGFAAWK